MPLAIELAAVRAGTLGLDRLLGGLDNVVELLAKGRQPNPRKAWLVTYTLQYNRQAWLILDSMEEHWKKAEIAAEIADEGTIRATTSNAAGFTISFEALPVPLDTTRPPRLVIDGTELAGPAVQNNQPWTASFRKNAGKWELARDVQPAPGLSKRPGLQGPIDHAFTDAFVFVKPTGKPMNETTAAWVKSELERSIPQWRAVFRGDPRVVDDTAVTPEMVANSNLVLWGDPSSNKVLARIVAQLPVKWSGETLQAANKSYPSANHVPVLIYPNPLNPKRYVVLNSSFTFRQGANTSNALQTPNLPDWAIVDLRTPPSAKWPGLIVDAGFFDERWQFKNQSAP
jgi:hypothetical protein